MMCFAGDVEWLTCLTGLVFFFLIGMLLPVITYLISLKWPNSFLRYVKYVFFKITFVLADA